MNGYGLAFAAQLVIILGGVIAYVVRLESRISKVETKLEALHESIKAIGAMLGSIRTER